MNRDILQKYPINSVNDETVQQKIQCLAAQLKYMITCLIAVHTPSSVDHTTNHKCIVVVPGVAKQLAVFVISVPQNYCGPFSVCIQTGLVVWQNIPPNTGWRISIVCLREMTSAVCLLTKRDAPEGSRFGRRGWIQWWTNAANYPTSETTEMDHGK